jgi:acetylornithine/N-succinyldiaminopimelate aminotransferase
MNTHEIIGQFDQYVIANYTRYPVVLVRGEGSRVWDADGKEYLDLFPGWGCGAIGHCPPRVVEAVREQVGLLIHAPNTWYMAPQGQLAQILSERSFGGKSFFCNSGAEAVEAAIKLARLHAPEGKYKIVSMLDSFHGRTFAAITATGQPKYHEGFAPLVAGFSYVPFNDVDALAKAIDEETCAVLLEPIQGEGGVNIPDPEFLSQVRLLCDQRGLLLILDEVQTGCGRTGQWFGYQNFDVVPDIMTLAKSLAGGLAMGALVAKPHVAESLAPGTHASTFGGNPIASAAAIATFETIAEDNLLEHVRELGAHAAQRLGELADELDIIDDVRVMGVMIGVELSVDGTPVVNRAMEQGLLINCTHNTVIRLLPAMNISIDELDRGLDILADVLREVST